MQVQSLQTEIDLVIASFLLQDIFIETIHVLLEVIQEDSGKFNQWYISIVTMTEAIIQLTVE